ncbi:MAG TPA: serine hydrolase [Paracoccaceae bacterium]|nr:serine hydrolase [Paracoccaceae bacterium]
MRPDRRAALAWFAAAALAGPAPARAAGQPPATGLDPGRLRRAAARAASLEQLHGLVVARGGEIALAEAFRGPPLDRPVNVKSVSKTIVALLAGAAIDRGLVGGVEARLAEVAPELIPPEADPRVGALTLAHLLTMQAGLERTSGPNYGRWVESRNWVATALSQPFVAAPGERMLYSTGSYHVLGAALARRSGRSLLAMARAWLGEPLGIAIPPWTRDPQGYYLGGNNMALSPLDLLRIGEMARQGGLWRGRPVLSQDWLRASWIPRTRSPWSGDTYGYGWFLSQARGHPLAYARGYGGQMLYVVPALGLTIVVTSDPTRPARSEGHVGALHALLAEEIVPAAEEA